MKPRAHWKRQVAASFERSADCYDSSADLQHDVARRLARRISQITLPAHARVLEIGCGTGFLTRALRPLLPHATWVATDVSLAMLRQCRAGGTVTPSVDYICMDGEHVAVTGAFDLICSSLVAQWFERPTTGLRALNRLLRPGGYAIHATLAEGTFSEWIAAHRELGLVAGTPTYPTIAALRALSDPGASSWVASERIRRHHRRALDFLAELRRVGATTPAPGHEPLPAATMRQMLRTIDASGGLDVSYHIAYACYQRPISS